MPSFFLGFLAYLKPKADFIVYPLSGVRPSFVVVHNFKHEYLCNQQPMTMKFYQKHYWDGGKASLSFWPDWIKTLVSMAPDRSHRVIMEKTVLPLFLSCFFIRSFLYLHIMMACMGARRS